MSPLLHWFGRRLADYLSQPRRGAQIATSPPELLKAALRPGDVLLVEGNTRISLAIKYLTQSTWAHAAFCIGDALRTPNPREDARILIEAHPGARGGAAPART